MDEIFDDNTDTDASSDRSLSKDDEDPVMEALNRAIRSLQANATSSDSLLSGFNASALSNQAATDSQLGVLADDPESEEKQELFLDHLDQPAGVGYEDSQVESTTEIIEFNLDGKLNKYIVKKEVQAVIVDIPNSYESSDVSSKNSFF